MESFKQKKTLKSVDVPKPLEHEIAYMVIHKGVVGHLPLTAVPHETKVPQQAELVRHGGPAPADNAGEVAHAQLLSGQRVEKLVPRRVGEHLEHPGERLEPAFAPDASEHTSNLSLVHVEDVTRVVAVSVAGDCPHGS